MTVQLMKAGDNAQILLNAYAYVNVSNAVVVVNNAATTVTGVTQFGPYAAPTLVRITGNAGGTFEEFEVVPTNDIVIQRDVNGNPIGLADDDGNSLGSGGSSSNTVNSATTAAITAAVNAAVLALVNGAPGALNTLKELADAINDDASFAATVTAALALRPQLQTGVLAASTTLVPSATAVLNALAAITPTSLGLGNVNNTADANKPVSTAQAAAIAGTSPRVSAIANNGYGVPPATYLPTVSSAPAAVYGMRKLVSGYAGAILQATRASDSTTIDATQTATGLPNATAVAAFAAGSAVTMSKWYDQSGNTRDAVQATLANQPIFDAAGLLGQAAASGSFKAALFDGWLDVANGNTRRPKKLTIPTSVAIGFQTHSIFLVIDPESALYNAIYYDLARSADASDATGVGTAAGVSGIYASGGAANTIGGRRARSQYQTFGITSSTTAFKFFQDGQISSQSPKWSDPLAGGLIGDGIAAFQDFMSHENFLAVVIYPVALSDADATSVINALNSAFAIPAPTAAQVVMVGDSIQYGATVNESLQGRTITRLVRPLLKGFPALYNMGLSSQTLTGSGGMAANAATREFVLAADGSYAKRVLFCEIGHNDLATNGSTAGYANTLYAALTAYFTAARAAGFTKIVQRTILPSNWTGQTAVEWANFNALIRANTAGADAISDVASDPIMGSVANVTSNAFYQGDGTHPTSYGTMLLAPYDAAAINSVL